jgi:hypothetical protein
LDGDHGYLVRDQHVVDLSAAKHFGVGCPLNYMPTEAMFDVADPVVRGHPNMDPCFRLGFIVVIGVHFPSQQMNSVRSGIIIV